jgi:hypothetical protein
MTISGILAALPSRRTFLTMGLSSLLGAAVAIGIFIRFSEPAGPAGPPSDPRFVPIGKAYLPALGKLYAAAWEEGAKSLDAGESLSNAIAAVGNAWNQNRRQLYDKMATPEFTKIVPESQNDAALTPQQRAAMAAAWRGFAKGLGK